MGATYECKWCGAGFEPTCHTSRQIYCSSGCRIKSNNAGRYAPPNDACVYCAGKIERLFSCGKYRKFCSDRCRKAYHAEKAAQKKRELRAQPRVCPFCGREFILMWQMGGTARFCSDECRVNFWKEYHKVTPGPLETPTECGYCGKALEVSGRKYCSRACYRLGAARARGERCCVWCGKILPKNSKRRKYCSKSCAGASSRHSNLEESSRCSIKARNPLVWRKQLREAAALKAAPSSATDRKVLLVCDKISLISTDTLVNFISYELGCDPLDGTVYLFCNSTRFQIKWLFWDGGGFCVSSRNSQGGRYPWPGSSSGETVEITWQEAEFIMRATTC